MKMRNFIIKKLGSFIRYLLNYDKVQELIVEILSKEKIQTQLWKNANLRPETAEMFYASVPNSLTEEVFRLATKQSAIYIDENMSHLYGISNPLDLLTFCFEEKTIKGLVLEFGVFSGFTINHIASQTDQDVHGFDSFEGLPEDWNSAKKGTFNQNGKMPDVADNVQLHAGWFEDTIDEFKNNFTGMISFMHIDCDLYSSTHTVLFSLKKQITKGTIIVFDEYFNYPGWQKHEYLAFKEFINETGKKYEYIAFAGRGFSVGVRIL